MALVSSGEIALAGSTSGRSVALELGLSATATISLNDAGVRTLAGVSSGAISLSNFYGKSNAPVPYVIAVSGTTVLEPLSDEDPTIVATNWGSTQNGLAVSPWLLSDGKKFTVGSAHNYGSNSGTTNEWITGFLVEGTLSQNYFTSIAGNGITLFTNNLGSGSFSTGNFGTPFSIWQWRFSTAQGGGRIVDFEDNDATTITGNFTIT